MAFRLEFSDREGCADQWLTWARMRDVDAPVPSEVAASLGIAVCTDVPRGVEGWADLEAGTIHVRPCADLVTYELTVGHEGAHHAQADWGIPREAHEATMPAVRLAMMMPFRSVQRAIAAHRLDIPALIRQYSLVPPTDVVRRVVALTASAALLDKGGGFLERVSSELHDVSFEPNRRELRELLTLSTKVRLTGRPAPWRFGIVAWPYREGPYMRCAIVLDVERSVHTRAG